MSQYPCALVNFSSIDTYIRFLQVKAIQDFRKKGGIQASVKYSNKLHEKVENTAANVEFDNFMKQISRTEADLTWPDCKTS